VEPVQKINLDKKDSFFSGPERQLNGKKSVSRLISKGTKQTSILRVFPGSSNGSRRDRGQVHHREKPQQNAKQTQKHTKTQHRNKHNKSQKTQKKHKKHKTTQKTQNNIKTKNKHNKNTQTKLTPVPSTPI